MPRPAEAQLIYEHRRRLGISIREAARRAGISEGSWRRTESDRDLTRTPDTVARMARAVGITPAELTLAGRPDAARDLDLISEDRTLTAEELEERHQRVEAVLEEALAIVRGRANGHTRAS